MSRFHCIHGFAKTQFRDEPVGTSPGIIGLFTIFRTILVEPTRYNLKLLDFVGIFEGMQKCRFSLFDFFRNKGESFSWGRTHRSQCVLTGDYILEGLRKMRKLILDLMLEAANHRFQDTTDRICFDKFQWSSFRKVDLEWKHRPRYISCWLYAQTSFVSLICKSSLRCPEKSLAFDKLHRLQYCIHRSIGRWGELPRPHPRDYQKSSDQPTFQAFTWHLSMIKMIHRDLLSSRPMFTTTICGSMTLSWWGVVSHGCGRGMLITL